MRRTNVKQKVLLLCGYTAADTVIFVILALFENFSDGYFDHLRQHHGHKFCIRCKRDQRTTFKSNSGGQRKPLFVIKLYALPNISNDAFGGLSKAFCIAERPCVENHVLHVIKSTVIIDCQLLKSILSHCS